MSEEIKVGSVVVVSGTRGRKWLSKIERETPTMWVTGHDNKYRKNSLIGVGGGDYYFSNIKLATKEDVDKIREQEHRDRLVAACRRANYTDLSTEDLEMFYSVLKKCGGTHE